MQVARTFFLSSERSYVRKLYEIALAYKIESSLSKDRIFEVYANQIFLGQRAYGFAAASQVYFGKKLRDVTVAEVATLAGLPVAPAAYNPFVNPKRAKGRQQYVLGRMLQLGFIDQATHDAALAQELKPRSAALASDDGPRVRLHAEYAAELARQLVFESSATRPTRAASMSTRHCERKTRRSPTPPLGARCSTTTASTAIEAPRPSSSWTRIPSRAISASRMH
jgi:penicillin-binding protein 1A